MSVRLVAAGLLLLLAGVAQAADRIEPVAPAKPVPEGVVKIFDEFFGEDVKKAAASADPADDGAVADRIMEEAQKRSGSHSEFAAYALDQVVRLASVVPGKQRLVYEALAVQKTGGLRPSRACLEKMMVVAPRVAAELSGPSLETWVAMGWVKDALELAQLQATDMKYEAAYQTLTGVQQGLAKIKAAPQADLDDRLKALDFMRALESSCRQYEAEVKQPGPQPRANMVMGILKLLRDKKVKESLSYLTASAEPAALDLVKALEAETAAAAGKADAKPDAAANFAVAKSLAALADKAPGLYFQMLLWKEAEDRLERCQAAGGLSDDDKLRADMLREKAARKSAEVQAQIPPAVRSELERLGESMAVATVDEGDEGAGQTFFGIPLKRARKIVYVVDRSGSMGDSFKLIKEELKQSIQGLRSDQEFYVNFYSTGAAVEIPGRKLLTANGENKIKAAQFIDSIVPQGQTDPADALKRAFALQPNTLCLLTDGAFDRSIIALIDDLNGKRNVVINTTCFYYNGGEALLKQIAEQNKGCYRFVPQEEIESMKVALAKITVPEPKKEPVPEPTKEPAADTTAKAPVKTAATDKPASSAVAKDDAAKPAKMTTREMDLLWDQVKYLENHRGCPTCRGTGSVGNDQCPDCAGSRVTTEPVERVSPTGMRYLYVGKRTIGNGVAKAEKLRPKIDEIIKVCNKFGDLVPAPLQARAKKICVTLDPNCAKEFPW